MPPVVWRLHLASPPEAVYDAIDSDAGRAGFWADTATEVDGAIRFSFANSITERSPILERIRPRTWRIRYFGADVRFDLEPDGLGGTDLTLTTEVPEADHAELRAGWLNVLLPLKAWVDHGIDLHNHDPARTWDQGYADH